MMPNALIAKGLVKRYKERTVIADLSIRVEPGEIVGLLGPNGAGKTTAFYLLTGLIYPDDGTIQLANQDITHLPIHKRATLGLNYLPQEASIFRKLTVSENILAILELRDDLSKSQRQERLQQLLNEFRIAQLSDTLGIHLSGGERRRVEIARAIAMQPTFILLDEPFAGIDPISIIDITKVIEHLSQSGIGVLITDHNVRETLQLCHRAYIVNNGKIICEGNRDAILANQEVRDVYLGQEFNM
jgi:lipopolysaccharide export system ATP-binding protein